MITQHAGWGPATPPANEVRRLMQKPEIKGAVFRGTVPLELYQVIADNAPDTEARVSHMQLTAINPATAQLQHRVQLYAQEAQHAPSDQHTYYHLLIHYQSIQPTNYHIALEPRRGRSNSTKRATPHTALQGACGMRTPGPTGPYPVFTPSSGCPRARLPIQTDRESHATCAKSAGFSGTTLFVAASRRDTGSAADAS